MAMMEACPGRSMVQPLPCSPGLGPNLGLSVSLTTAAAAAAFALASPGAAQAQAYVPFPSQESLRRVQLAALACARDNSAPSCQEARQLADPLLDHPRLPAACKDQLWAVREKAQPAGTNSFARREAISQPAQLLLLACRSGEAATPPAPSAAPAAGSGGAGLKFGGGR